MSECIEITKENFESEVLKSDIPVLIDFWAAWCAPCRMVSPIVEQLAEEYASKIKVGKVDVDAESELAGNYNIVSIPALIVFHEGKIANQTAGAMPKQNIESLFKDFL